MVALVLPDAAEIADRVAVACEVLGRDRGLGEGGDGTSGDGEGLSGAQEKAEPGAGTWASGDWRGGRRVLGASTLQAKSPLHRRVWRGDSLDVGRLPCYARRLLIAPARPSAPVPRSRSVEGSGTGEPGWRVMSSEVMPALPPLGCTKLALMEASLDPVKRSLGEASVIAHSQL